MFTFLLWALALVLLVPFAALGLLHAVAGVANMADRWEARMQALRTPAGRRAAANAFFVHIGAPLLGLAALAAWMAYLMR